MSGASRPPAFTAVKLSPHERWGSIQAMGEAARLAEGLGFYGIYFPDHLIMPAQPGAATSAVWYDNFVVAAHLASVTRRIKLIFYVLVVPYHPPIQTAKQLATLDTLSGGRVILGTGVGWLKGEFDLLGLPFHQRGVITDEYLRAMRALWTQESPTVQGKYVRFSNACFLPKCVQKPHIPLWIGGDGPHAWRRAVEMGDGWVPMTGTLERLGKGVAWISERVRAQGRDPGRMTFSHSIGVGERDSYTPHPAATTDLAHRAAAAAPIGVPYDAEAAIDGIGRLQDAGFNHIYVRFNWGTPVDLARHMEWFAAHVMPAFRG